MWPSTILFDLDDTLVDRAVGLHQYASRLHDDMRPSLHPCTSDHLHAALLAADDYGSTKQAANLAGASLWRYPPDVQWLVEHWAANFGKAAQPFPGVIELLFSLRDQGMKLGIITNGASTMQRTKIAALGIEHLFNVIIVSAEVGLEKPDRAIFELALRRVDCSTNDAWFVGDHPDMDIVAAERAGLKAFWVRTGEHRHRANVPGTHLDCLTELLSYLR